MTIEYPIFFIHKDGTIHRADTPEEARNYGFDEKHRYAVRYYTDGGRLKHEAFYENDWIARDALGQTVIPSDFPYIRHPNPRRRRLERELRVAIDKGLPIPGTGHVHRHGSRDASRTMRRNVSAHGWAEGARQDLRESGIASRWVNCLNDGRKLPSWWDDSPNRCGEHCWKSQRRTKWKTARE